MNIGLLAFVVAASRVMRREADSIPIASGLRCRPTAARPNNPGGGFGGLWQ